ncbi:MAG TPA: tRNA lysidine(34) synthetase TilS [Cryomorphaceae bacterium]|nr:tRNA lysidine(34) synthetase TilS [Cryomorphaceae bacterium]
MDCQQSVSDFLKNEGLNSNSSFLLACSGGLDSVTLLHILVHLGHKPALAHCNFQLRGDESDGDEALVKKLAEKHHLPLHTKRFDTQDFATGKGISIQMAARELRYAFFRELMQLHAYQHLLTAHHQDDSLETLLINLGRGTGISGLGISGKNGTVLRPMLRLGRMDLQSYAQRHQLQWREDSSNKKVDYQRNFIRHKVVPAFRQAFSSVDSGLRTLFENLESDIRFFKYALSQQLGELIEKKKDEERMPMKPLVEKDFAKTLLNAWLSPMGFTDLEAIVQSLQQESGAVFHSQSHVLLRDREYLILKKRVKPDQEVFMIQKTDQRIDHPLRMKFSIRLNHTFEIPVSPHQAGLDLDLLEFPLVLRHWKAGDSFRPLGMKGFKKLSNFFTDIKLNRFEKEDVWLLCSGENIVWVVGHRIDDRFKVSGKTKTVYFVDLLN